MQTSQYDAKDEQALMTELWDPALADDLEKFVLFVYPWGKSGTPLANRTGPRSWQRDDLQAMTEHIRNNRERVAMGLEPVMYREATASGRGTGKSAKFAWLTHWMMTTRLGSTCVVTANTEPQLKSRTFAEIGRWGAMALNKHWFEYSVLSVKPRGWFSTALRDQLGIDSQYYYTQGQLWSEESPDAFAGVHNPAGVLLIFDEASGIPIPIYTVSEGFFTEPEIDRYWLTASNPRRNSGGFFDSFHSQKKRWRLRHLDSRTVEGTDKTVLQEIVDTYGEDSDTANIEVRGLFPVQGDKQFISNKLAKEAQERKIDQKDNFAPLIMGVDVARYGRDHTVLRFRRGRDARSIPAVRIKGFDNVEVADTVAHWADKLQVDAINIDAGNGTGVIDILRHSGYRVNEVWFGAESTQREYAFKRTDMWAQMREWLKGGMTDGSPDLNRDLTTVEYGFFGAAKDKIILESKESLTSRGIPSPDDGDALALTFAVPVARKDSPVGNKKKRQQKAIGVDYDLFSS